MNVNVKEHLERAARSVQAAQRKFESSVERRMIIATEDLFLDRVALEIARERRERSSVPLNLASAVVVSNRPQIEEVLRVAERGSSTSTIPSFYFGEDSPQFAVGGLVGEVVAPPPSGVWASREIVSQREYDVDAVNNQEPEELASSCGAVVEHDGAVELVANDNGGAPAGSEEHGGLAVDCVGEPLPTVPPTSAALELSSLFNRLVSNNALFFFPEVDEFNSTQFAAQYVVQHKVLSPANGRLLRRFFDSAAPNPTITYATRKWTVRRSILEAILQGHFDLESQVHLVRDIDFLSEELAEKNRQLQNCERCLLHERSKSRHLAQKLDQLVAERRRKHNALLHVALQIDAAVQRHPAAAPHLATLLAHDPTTTDVIVGRERSETLEEIYGMLQKVGEANAALGEKGDVGGESVVLRRDGQSANVASAALALDDTHERHVANLQATMQRKLARVALQERFQSLERCIMELEDSHSGYGQMFAVGENVYCKMNSIAQVLDTRQREAVFGKDLALVQFYELTKAREATCPLCRFDFDATKPLSFYAEQIQEKARRVTEEIHVIVGRKRNQSVQPSQTDELNGTMKSRSSLGSAKKGKSSASGVSDSSTRPPTAVADTAVSQLQEFETQVAMMALEQMNADLELQLKKMQEKLDEGTATLRMEKMHSASLEGKYKDALRDSGELVRKLDAEARRAADMQELFRQEMEQLRRDITQLVSEKEDLEDHVSELNQKLERADYSEKQINTLRFGYPVTPTQKADLTFQEIGYVFYRKYFETREQLAVLKRHFRFECDAENATVDSGVNTEGKVVVQVAKKTRDSTTNCSKTDFVAERAAAAQTEVASTESAEVQTDPEEDVVLRRADNPMEIEVDKGTQTEEQVEPAPSFSLQWIDDKQQKRGGSAEGGSHAPREGGTAAAMASVEAWLESALPPSQRHAISDAFAAVRASHARELSAAVSAALDSSAQRHEAAVRALESMFRGQLTAKDKLVANAAAERDAALASLEIARAESEALRLSKRQGSRRKSLGEGPGSGVLSVRSRRVDAADPTLCESNDEEWDVDTLCQLEATVRADIVHQSGALPLVLPSVVEIVAALHRSLRNCRCKRAICSVVNLELNDVTLQCPGRHLLAPVDSTPQQGKSPRPAEDERQNGRVSGFKQFDFAALQQVEALLTPRTGRRSPELPEDADCPLPLLPGVVEPVPTAARRFERVVRHVRAGDAVPTALTIKSLQSHQDARGVSHDAPSEARSCVADSHAAKPGAEGHIAQGAIHAETRGRTGLPTCSFGPDNAGIDTSTLLVRSPTVCDTGDAMTRGAATSSPPPPLPVVFPHHKGPNQPRHQSALLAVRLQSLQRLSTPSEGASLDGEAGFALPVPSLKGAQQLSLDDLDHSSPVATGGGAFLARPLPLYRGAIPPTTITGTSADSVLKKPSSGFHGGWDDSVTAAQRNRLNAAAVAAKVSRARESQALL